MGEVTTPFRCGRTDQGCAYGDYTMLMTFDRDHLDTQEVQLENDLCFVLVDLDSNKDSMEILKRLNRCYPFAETDLEHGVQELLGPSNKKIVPETSNALKESDTVQLGKLMIDAQELFDRFASPICPKQLTVPAMYKALNYPPLSPFIWGGKGVGSQEDGSAQFITRSFEDQQSVIEILGNELDLRTLSFTIHPTQKVKKSINSSRWIRNAIIPSQ